MECDKARKFVPNDTRKCLISAVVAEGRKLSEICSILRLNKRTAQRIIQTFYRTNREDRLIGCGRTRVYGERVENAVVEYVSETADATLKEIQNYIAERSEELGISRPPSLTTLDRILRKNKVSFKTLSRVPRARNTKMTIELRFKFMKTLNELARDDFTLVYMDEMGCNLHVRRRFGRSLIGQPATIDVVGSRGNNLSICAVIREDKMLYYESKYGSYNHSELLSFLENLLVVLSADNRKYAVVMDNVAFHRHKLVQDWFSNHQLKQIFLPPYSPMLNPIEEAFSKVHSSLCLSRASTGPQLSLAVSRAFVSITEADCRGWYRHTIAYHTQCWQKKSIYTAAEPNSLQFEIEEREQDELEDPEINEEMDELLML